MNPGAVGGNGSSRAEEPWIRIEPAHSWKDLVLPEQARTELQAIPVEFRKRSQGPGVQYLFLGERGTGKTMAAQVIGAELRQPILEMDLAEEARRDGARPEELVERVFDAAERERAIVLFDGVGALFGGRGRAGERPPAVDISKLLDRGRRYPGIVVLASRLTRRIPDTVAERLDGVIDFPFPDSKARAHLWRNLLPPDARVSDADIEFLAASFRLAGASIASCCAAASRLAQDDGGPVQLHHVARAVEHEYRNWVLGDQTRAALAKLRSGSGLERGGRGGGQMRTPPAAAPSPPAPAEAAPRPAAPAAREPSREPTREPAREPTREPIREPVRERAREPVREPSREPVREPSPGPAPPVAPPPSRPTGPRPTPAPAGMSASAATAALGAPRVPLRPAPTITRDGDEGARARMYGLGLAALVAAVVLGFVAARALNHTGSSHQTTQRVAAGPLEVSVPSSWHKASSPTLPLSLKEEVAVGPRGSRKDSLTIGTTSTGTSGLLPTAGTPAPGVVMLGSIRFYRYLDWPARGDSVYTLATSGGTVAGLCLAPRAPTSFRHDCEQVLSSLRLRSGNLLPLGTSAGYAASLNRIVGTLNAARSSADARLQSARTAQEQAKAATQLASAHATAATAVAQLDAGSAGGQNAALADALRSVAAAYTALARAAARHDAAGYKAATTSVSSAEQALSTAFAALEKLGYRVG